MGRLAALITAVVLLTGCGGAGSMQTAMKTASTGSPGESHVTVTVATVNNPDMIIMEKLAHFFEEAHPGIRVRFVTLPDQDLREKVTLDASQGTGQYDVVTIGPYEVATWPKNHWLVNLDDLFAKMSAQDRETYDLNDIIPSIRGALTNNGALYALPFYGESSMLYYRKDLFAAKGLTMPDEPTWDQVAEFARVLHDPAHGVYGIVLKGIAQYGQIAPVLTEMNSFGCAWFDMNWHPLLTSEPCRKALRFYVDLLHKYGEPGATNVGFNEGEALMAQGKAAMWYDATVAAGYLNDPANSKVVGKVGYAMAPKEVTSNGSHWLYTWALAIVASSKHKDAAFRFITWATSKEYIQLVAKNFGWNLVPPGTRRSTYQNPNYLRVAPWAEITLRSIETADVTKPTNVPVPYTGLAQIHIPEYAAFAAKFAQYFAAAVAGTDTPDGALAKAQRDTEEIMRQAGYYK